MALASIRQALFAATLAIAPAAPLVVSLAATGCGDLKEAFELSKDIKTETGIDTNVAFETTNGHTKLTITLGKKPDDPAATEKKIIELAKKRFPQADEITVVQ